MLRRTDVPPRIAGRPPRQRGTTGAALLFLLLSAPLSSGSAVSAADGPDAQSVATLVLLNRFRGDPQGEAEHLLRWEAVGIPGIKQPDLALFRHELAALRPVPPLVFEAELVQAARNHADYLVRHRLVTRAVNGHHEDPAQAGYTGHLPADRLRAVGYRGLSRGENLHRFATSPLAGQQGLIIDWGEGPGGMLPGRGHRTLMMDAQATGIGIAMVLRERGQHVLVQEFGALPRPGRLLGGVVFRDRNGNGRYDPGEGLAGVGIRTDSGEAGSAWASGAFTLEIAHRRALRVTLSIAGHDHVQDFPGSAHSQWLSWALPDPQRLRAYQAACRKAARGETGAAVECWFLGARLPLDATAVAERAALVGTVATDLEEQYTAVLQALQALDRRRVAALAAEVARRWPRSSFATWCQDAGRVAELAAETAAFIDLIRRHGAAPADARDALLRTARRLLDQVEGHELEELLGMICENLLVMTRS